MIKKPFVLPKYQNKRNTLNDQKFDSLGERNRYLYLCQLERDGKIRNLKRQVRFELVVNDDLICAYVADFMYHLKDDLIVEDFKGGYRLPNDFVIKNKLMKAIYGITIKIVKNPTESL
jgi:hypothetical protein